MEKRKKPGSCDRDRREASEKPEGTEMPTLGTAYDELFCEARFDRVEMSGRRGLIDQELERRQWEAVLAVINAYTSTENIHRQYEPILAFPIEVANYI